jgi:glutamate synthase domain-containing protein 1
LDRVKHNCFTPTIVNRLKAILSSLVREDKTGELRLNFDEGFYSLLNENEKLMKLDIPLPSINQFLVKQKIWFYEYRSRIQANYSCSNRYRFFT